ncbi:hypothetical protein LAZ67_19002292, partial [Cordylochernes scorpioides]
METEDIVPSTSAVPFVVPHTTSTARTNAQRQREYRLRKALTRTPEQVRAFAKAAAERQRRFKLRKSANIVLTSGTSESPASTSCSVVERTSVPVVAERTSVPLTNAQRQRAFRQRRAASSRTDVQPTTSSSQTAIQLEQSTWYTKWSSSIRRFQSTFLDNDFGHACSVCDRLWFKNHLKTITALQLKVISDWYVKENRQLRKEDYTKSCNTCRQSLNKRKLPTLAKVNGFSYPDIPPGLPPLDPISERLVSPRLPFMQVRRLRHDFSYGIIGQVINVPVNVQDMVKCLPRHLEEDDVINVNIKRNLAHRTNYISGYMSKRTVKEWLDVLQNSSLYRLYDIKIDLSRLQPALPSDEGLQDDPANRIEAISAEYTPESEVLAARQHTLLWNEEDCLDIAPGHRATPLNIIYDRHAEELSFPAIYFGEPRRFNMKRFNNVLLYDDISHWNVNFPGSVLSPTLFTLFIAGIEEKISHKTNIGLFADDIILWSSNTNWKKAERDLNKTLLHLEKFANKHKLEFNPQKSETCLFTTDKKLYKIRPKIILKEQQLQYNKHPKYLGYTLDPEINSSKHIEEVIRKGRDRLKILKYISGREWGADATTLKLTYTSLIRPILEYGYQIYGTASETNLKSLERIQLSAARIITGLRNTCPNDIVLYEADIMPLKDRRSYNLPKYINKIKSYGNKHRTSNYILNWESNLRLKKEGPLHLAKRNGFLKYKVEKNYLAEKNSPCEPLQNVIFNDTLNEPTNKQYQNPEYLKQLSLEIINNIPKNAITIYTDGSRDELGHTGSGCLIKTTNGIEKMNRRNPDFCSVFRSELIAIYEALKSIRNTNYQDIWILTDSRSAIQHLSHTGELRDKVSRNIIGYLQKLSKSSKIHLQWIPSHVGIEGNEAADVLAKKGTKEPLPQKNKLTFKEIETVAKTKINKNWRIPPKHSWYSGVNPGGALNIRNRQHQTTLTSRDELGHTGSGCLIKTTNSIEKMNRRNPDFCSVFRSELIAIYEALKSIRNTNYQDIWILTDSRSAIKHLSHTGELRDKVSRNIIGYLQKLSKTSKIHLQWIPSHVGIEGNEAADVLAKKGTKEPLPQKNKLTFKEIETVVKTKINKNWRIPPMHSWYSGVNPGGALNIRNRQHQTTLTRFRTGHLKPLKIENNNKIYPTCPKCSLAPAAPDHILACIRCTKQDLWERPLLIIKQLEEHELMEFQTKIKLEEIMEIAEKQKIQIIALQETKLNEKYNLKYKNYNILRKDRNKEGGGLAFLIKNLYYEDIAINIPNTSDLEAQGIKVYLSQNKTIDIFNMYHPPNNKLIDDGTMAQFLTDNTIIVGDLNAKHQLWGCSMPNPRGKILSNLFDDNAFMCLNDGNPTHHSYSYNTAQALDISFSSPDIFHKCKWQILKSIGSDHLPILIEISTKTKTSSIKEKFWNFKKANWNLYQKNTNEDFRKAPTRIKDLEQNWISFKNTIIKAASCHQYQEHFKIDGKAITWINDFLKNRYIRVKYNGTLSKTFKLYQGLPQGSVLSPTLFTLFIAGIEEKISHKTNIGLFADDIILWSSNTNWKKAERDLNKTLLHLEKFANKHKLEFNPQKSETCLFTTDKKLYKIRPKIILKEQQLQYNKHPKYLGYTLDPEINSSKHIEEVIRKGRDRLKILKYISGREWGADATTLKLTYTSLIRPILEYGYQIYGTASETNLKSLERIQLSEARIITGLRNTCPNDNVLYEADIMPLKDRRSYNLPKYINKIKSYGNKHRTSNYILNWESNLRLKKEGPLHLAKRNGFLKYNVEKKLFSRKISPCEPLQNVIFNDTLNEPTNKQYQNPEYLKQLSLEIINNIPKNAITIYTNGSRDELGHTGSGCLIKTTNGIEKMNRRNPDFCSVFRSELIAIYEALKSIRNTNYQDIWILTDSRSAIQHLSHTGELRDKVSRNIIGYLQKLSKTSKIHLQWIPSHVGIEGNEAADVLAKKGTKEPLPQKNKLTFKEIETVAKINKNWRIPLKHSWYSGVNPGGVLNIGNRQHQTTLTRFRTGHLKPLKIENNNKIYPTCPK